MNKPFAESSVQNREPILEVIKPLFATARAVLEIGSGTGQHAVYFAAAMPQLIWHTSDVTDNHNGIRQWLDEASLPNTRPPITLHIGRDPWPEIDIDSVFSANTAHIMHWPEVELLFQGVGELLPPGGKFALYGPFNYDGQYTSESNARFDQWLKQRNPHSGIKDFEALEQLAKAAGLVCREDFTMPANNRIIYWQKLS